MIAHDLERDGRRLELTRRDPRRRTGAQRGIMVEHAALQLDELRPGFETELLGETSPQVLEGAQRFGLSAGPVGRHHPLAAQPFVQRIFVGERVELAQRLEILTALQAGVGAAAERVEPAPIEAGPLGDGPRPRELLERGAAPETQRTVEQPEPAPEIGLDPGRAHHRLEARRVERVVLELEHVPRRLRRQFGTDERQHLAQL